MSAEDELGEQHRATGKSEITASNWMPQRQMQMWVYLEISSGWDSEATREVFTSPDLETDGQLALSDAFFNLCGFNVRITSNWVAWDTKQLKLCREFAPCLDPGFPKPP